MMEIQAVTPVNDKKITKKDLNKVFINLHLFNLTMTYDMAQGIGFYTCMAPILDKLYSDADKETRKVAMDRHMNYYLSQITATGIVLGITTALEETTPEEEKGEVIPAVKAGMMGPLAGIGDSLFKITVQAIAGSIGAALALEGNFLGPIIMFLIYNVINTGIKYYGIHIGYTKGVEAFSGSGNNSIQRLINSASVLGLMVLGSLIASSVKINIATEIPVGGDAIKIQELLDGVMPNLLPLIFTFGIYMLIRKIDRKYLVVVIVAILIIGTILATMGILG